MKHLIVLIHGVRTAADADWMDRARRMIEVEYPDTECVIFKYRKIWASHGWLLALRRKVHKHVPWVKETDFGFVKKFRNKLRSWREIYPDYAISIIGHSNGTHIAYNALEKYPDLKINTLVLVNGVISSHIEKTQIRRLLAEDRIKRIVAWADPNDKVVGMLMGEWVYGKLGCRGFRAPGDKEYTEPPNPQPYPELEIFNEWVNPWEFRGRTIMAHSRALTMPEEIRSMVNWCLRVPDPVFSAHS